MGYIQFPALETSLHPIVLAKGIISCQRMDKTSRTCVYMYAGYNRNAESTC